MSKTVAVDFGDRWFSAYDVSLSILLLEVIHVANARPQQPEQSWPEEVLDNFRQTALLGANIGLDLDPGRPQAQQDHVLALFNEAGRRLRHRGLITAAEASQRYVVQGEPVFLRCAELIYTGAIADLADAIIDLVRDDLPHPPQGATTCCYGFEGGPTAL